MKLKYEAFAASIPVSQSQSMVTNQIDSFQGQCLMQRLV